MAPLYLLSSESVCFPPFSSFIYFWSSFFLAARSFLSSETNHVLKHVPVPNSSNIRRSSWSASPGILTICPTALWQMGVWRLSLQLFHLFLQLYDFHYWSQQRGQRCRFIIVAGERWRKQHSFLLGRSLRHVPQPTTFLYKVSCYMPTNDLGWLKSVCSPIWEPLIGVLAFRELRSTRFSFSCTCSSVRRQHAKCDESQRQEKYSVRLVVLTRDPVWVVCPGDQVLQGLHFTVQVCPFQNWQRKTNITANLRILKWWCQTCANINWFL